MDNKNDIACDIIYTCKEHVDMAIDDYVNEFEVAPTVEICTDKTCKYCSEPSQYKVSK